MRIERQDGMTVIEAGRALGVTRRTIEILIAKGDIVVIQGGVQKPFQGKLVSRESVERVKQARIARLEEELTFLRSGGPK